MAVIVKSKLHKSGRTELGATFHRWQRGWPTQAWCQSKPLPRPLVLSRQQAIKFADPCGRCYPRRHSLVSSSRDIEDGET